MAQVQTRLQANEKALQALQIRKHSSLAEQAISGFISRKAHDEGYKKYLGITSTIQKDFQKLSDLFAAREIEKLDAKTRKKAEELKAHFNKPLNRIVLFIDDLDRCPVNRVVEVLDAVKLLLCYDLFVVVVGVDPKWVENSLKHKHYAQFGNYGQEALSKNHPIDLGELNPLKYLEKIFQIPYHIPIPGETNRKQYIAHLFAPLSPAKESMTRTIKDTTDHLKRDASQLDKTSDKIPAEKDMVQELSYSEMGEEERREVQSTSLFIGDNPRTLKRFSNLYRLIRVHREIQQLNAKTEKGSLKSQTVLALLNTDYPILNSVFCQHIGTDEEMNISSLLTKDEVKNEPQNHPLLHEISLLTGNDQPTDHALELTMAELKPYYDVIKQYSFTIPK